MLREGLSLFRSLLDAWGSSLIETSSTDLSNSVGAGPSSVDLEDFMRHVLPRLEGMLVLLLCSNDELIRTESMLLLGRMRWLKDAFINQALHSAKG